jgi:hypothetical protein
MAIPLVFALGGMGCDHRPTRPPTDRELKIFFDAHRADLDSLRANSQASMRLGAIRRDPALSREWQRLVERIGLPGGGTVESVNRIFVPVWSQAMGADSVDSKGFAWVDSIQPPGSRLDTLTHLDRMDPHARSSAGRHLLHLEGHWWIYRWIDKRMTGD